MRRCGATKTLGNQGRLLVVMMKRCRVLTSSASGPGRAMSRFPARRGCRDAGRGLAARLSAETKTYTGSCTGSCSRSCTRSFIHEIHEIHGKLSGASVARRGRAVRRVCRAAGARRWRGTLPSRTWRALVILCVPTHWVWVIPGGHRCFPSPRVPAETTHAQAVIPYIPRPACDPPSPWYR